jgi:RsmE family RNA methyltransferase
VNLILLEPEDFVGDRRVRLEGRRFEHVRGVHRKGEGDELRVGQIDGLCGRGRVEQIDESGVELEVTLDTPPPPPSPIRLVVALPRPPSLRKVLQQATALGVKELVLLHTRRVEKSYWQSHGLAEGALRRQLLLGLEQARDTVLPQVLLQRRFRPFVEDELALRVASEPCLVAHPDAERACPRAVHGPLTLVIGPEGGFVPFEIERLVSIGAECVGLGERVLRVETAVVALLARLAA